MKKRIWWRYKKYKKEYKGGWRRKVGRGMYKKENE